MNLGKKVETLLERLLWYSLYLKYLYIIFFIPYICYKNIFCSSIVVRSAELPIPGVKYNFSQIEPRILVQNMHFSNNLWQLNHVLHCW